jgi:fluoroquinolone resistance protein
MVERRDGAANPAYDTTIAGEDWYGRELADVTHERIRFMDVDFTEVVSVGAVFSECTFRNVKFNASRHERAAFLNCTFVGCNFFDARFERSKFTGSLFDSCEFPLLRVDGGDWSFTGFPGAALEKVVFEGVRMRETDLTFARCSGATFAGCDLSGSWFQGANFGGATLTGSDLGDLDPRTVELQGAFIDGQQAVRLMETMGLRVIA